MKRLKEDILKNNHISTSSPSENSIPSPDSSVPSTSSFTINSSTRSSNVYVYGVGDVAVMAMRACIFFLHNKKSSQTVNKKHTN